MSDGLTSLSSVYSQIGPVSRRSRKNFRTRKAVAKFKILRLHSRLIEVDVPFIQEVSGVYTSPSVPHQVF